VRELPVLSFPDLKATVVADAAPPASLEQLSLLYNTIFSTLDWWETQDLKTPTGICELTDPRHILAFTKDGRDVEILNKVFFIRPEDVRRACQAIFRSFPDVDRIRLEILFPPSALGLPHRLTATGEHMVIDLPAGVAEYDASLGKRTRGNIRNFQNRLRRDHPDVVTRVSVPGDGADALFEQFLAWKMERFHSQGRTTFWEDLPYQVDRFKALARRRAEVHVTSIDGAPAAIRMMFPVGVTTVSLQGSFDPAYSRYRLGLLSSYWAICDAIERGMRQINLLWGTTDYKSHLGATPRPTGNVSIYRSRLARLRASDEALVVARRECGRRARAAYWDSRARARGLLERSGVIGKAAATGGGDASGS
jgi:CelD/BcsL family acetyltransferase involved in cellulose biosynthesis